MTEKPNEKKDEPGAPGTKPEPAPRSLVTNVLLYRHGERFEALPGPPEMPRPFERPARPEPDETESGDETEAGERAGSRDDTKPSSQDD